MRLRQISLWLGLVAVLLSSGCCHHRCGWRHRGCCAPACPTTCCHPGDESMAPAYPVYSAPPLATSPTMLHAPMPVGR